jgi:hypothetical protein
MEATERRLVEREARRKAGGGHTVAAATEALGVARGAEVAGACSAHAVLADEVSVVSDVALGANSLRRQVDVTALAVAHRELVPVMVTAEAGGHRRQQRLCARLTGGDVASHTLTVRSEDVSAVLEAEILARELGALTRVGRAVAVLAVVRIVRLFMALRARGSLRDVERPDLTRGRDPAVALEAAHPLEQVRAMLERLHAGGPRLDAEEACTGRKREAADDEKESNETARHRALSHE